MTLEELNGHWRQWMKEIVERDTRPPVEIVVNRRRGITMLVDPAFGYWAYLSGLSLTPNGYARYTKWENGERTRTRIHRMIAEACGLAIEGMDVDHKYGNKLDNRLANLRPATTAQNQQNQSLRKDNSSGFRGVNCDRGRWRAEINHNGKRHRLGYYDTPELAAAARDAAAIELHGEFARLNFEQVMESN